MKTINKMLRLLVCSLFVFSSCFAYGGENPIPSNPGNKVDPYADKNPGMAPDAAQDRAKAAQDEVDMRNSLEQDNDIASEDDVVVMEREMEGLLAPSDLYIFNIGKSPKGFTIYFKWQDNAFSETGFEIMRSYDGVNFTKSGTKLADSENCWDRPGENVTAWYKVRAYVIENKVKTYSDYSNTVCLTTVYSPVNLTSQSIARGEARLSWQDDSENELGFRIERSRDGGLTYELIGTLEANNDPNSKTVTFIDTGLEDGVIYQYRVKSFTEVGESLPSNITVVAPGVMPGPSRDLNLRIAVSTTPTVNINWIDMSNSEKGFRIVRSDGVTSTIILDAPYMPGTGLPGTFSDKIGLARGVTYTYSVYSYNDSGESAAIVSSITVPNLPPENPNPGQSRVWYVNPNAIGNSDGSKMENAWRDVNCINWAVVRPGDTIYLGAGVYTNKFIIPISGEAGKPIIIKTAQNGRVIFKNGINLSNSKWITIDGTGNLGPEYLPGDTMDIKNNINIEVTNAAGNGIDVMGCIGIRLVGIEVHDCLYSGILFQNKPEYSEIYGCYSHDNKLTGIKINQGKGARYGEIAIHHNVVYRNMDNGVVAGGGSDVYNNIIIWEGDESSGHSDGIQGGGMYKRIYNNILKDFPNAFIWLETHSASAKGGHWQIYNNLMYTEKVTTNWGINLGAHALHVEPVHYLALVEWEEILIANNTFIGIEQQAIKLGKTANISSTTGGYANYVRELRIKNMVVKNNIIHDCGGKQGATALSLKGYVASGIIFSETDLVLDNNIISGVCTGIEYGAGRESETSYANAEELGRSTIHKNNTSLAPLFEDYANDDFRIDNEDTNAIGKGEDLSLYFNTDINGKERPRGSAWTIGAYEITAANPPQNRPPVIEVPVVPPVQEDAEITIKLSGTDPDNDRLIYTINLPLVDGKYRAAHGTLSATGDPAVWIYTPDADYNGTDSFTYKLNDGKVDSNIGTVDIRIESVNDAPIAATGLKSEGTDDAEIRGQLAGSDVDSPVLKYRLASNAQHGTVVINESTGEYVYTASGNYNGGDWFTFVVDDGQIGSEAVRVDLSIKHTAKFAISGTVPSITNKNTLTVSYTIDNGELQTKSFELVEGENNGLTISGVDCFGNPSTYEIPAVKLDTTAPVIKLAAGFPSLTNKKLLTVTYTVDGGTEQTKTFNLAEGDNTKLTIEATDEAGNSVVYKLHSVRLDTKPPVIKILSPISTTTRLNILTVTYKVDGGGVRTKKFLLKMGANDNLTINAIDSAGNRSTIVLPAIYRS